MVVGACACPHAFGRPPTEAFWPVPFILSQPGKAYGPASSCIHEGIGTGRRAWGKPFLVLGYTFPCPGVKLSLSWGKPSLS
eukprot:238229-Chlamydomonas_euryale.AAC.1